MFSSSYPPWRAWPSNPWWSCWQWRKNKRPNAPLMKRSTPRYSLLSAIHSTQLSVAVIAQTDDSEPFGMYLTNTGIIWTSGISVQCSFIYVAPNSHLEPLYIARNVCNIHPTVNQSFFLAAYQTWGQWNLEPITAVGERQCKTWTGHQSM